MVGVTQADFDEPNAPFLTWVVSGTVRRVETDQLSAAYAWERRMRSPDGDSRSGEDEATLQEDGRILLDLVPVSSLDAPADCYHNIALELGASVRDDPTVADRRLTYDLWLVSDDDGTRVTRRQQLIGKQGGKVDFDYGPLLSKHTRASTANTSGGEVETTVSGHVRGRVQADGSIEIALFAERGTRPVDGHWGTAAHGQKVLRAAPGEALRLELPPPNLGGLTQDAETLAAVAGHEVSLVLKTTNLQP